MRHPVEDELVVLGLFEIREGGETIWVANAENEFEALHQFVKEHPYLTSVYLARGVRLRAVEIERKP